MSGNPYENEPGFEEANEASDKKNQEEYVQKVWGMLARPPCLPSKADTDSRRSATRHCAYR